MAELKKNDIILNEVRELKEIFIEHKTKIETVLFGTDGKCGIATKVDEHEKEINKIKVIIAKWSGGAVVISVFVTWILNKFFTG